MSANGASIEYLRLFVLKLYDENEGTRNAAAGHIYRWMSTNAVHPADLIIDLRSEEHNRTDRVIKRLEQEIEGLRRELKFYRSGADEKRRRQATKAVTVVNRWDEFAALAEQRLGKLGHGWQTTARKMVQCSKTQMDQWRRGLAAIPEVAFDRLRTAEIPTKSPPKRRKKLA